MTWRLTDLESESSRRKLRLKQPIFWVVFTNMNFWGEQLDHFGNWDSPSKPPFRPRDEIHPALHSVILGLVTFVVSEDGRTLKSLNLTNNTRKSWRLYYIGHARIPSIAIIPKLHRVSPTDQCLDMLKHQTLGENVDVQTPTIITNISWPISSNKKLQQLGRLPENRF